MGKRKPWERSEKDKNKNMKKCLSFLEIKAYEGKLEDIYERSKSNLASFQACFNPFCAN